MISIRKPNELRTADAGTYSVHYYGEARGVVVLRNEATLPSAVELLSEDEAEARAATGACGLPAMSVEVIRIDADGDAWLLDEASREED